MSGRSEDLTPGVPGPAAPFDRLPGRPDLASAARPNGFNPVSMWTLYRRAVWSYLKLWKMTVAGPALTKLLYLSVFGLAGGGVSVDIGGMSLVDYIVPGLVVLAMALGAYQHPAYMILHDKLEGNICDELMAPMHAWERTVAHLAVGVTTGLSVGAVTWLLFSLLVPVPMAEPGAVLLFGGLGSLTMACCGAITGILCAKWDQLSAIETFLIMPLVFLSGTFFALADLPGPAQAAMAWNPVFFTIDGIRYGLTGTAQFVPWQGAFVLAVIGALLSALVYCLVRSGRGLKS